MRSHVLKIWESLRSKPKKKARPTARLGVEMLEDRCVPTVSATMSSVADQPASIQSGLTSTVTVIAEDTTGAPITGLSATDFVFGLGGGGTSQGSFGSFNAVGGGTYTETFTGTTAGTANTITATIDGTLVSTAPSITVTPGAVSATTSVVSDSPASIQSGKTTLVTVIAKDAAGNLITSLTGPEFAFDLGSAPGTTSQGVFNTSSFTNNNDGTYTETFTGAAVGTPNTITVTIDGTPITTAPSITVTASGTKSTVTDSPASIASGSTSTVTVIAEDAAGTPITNLGASDIVFGLGSAASGTSQGTFNAASFANLGSGKYTETFTGTTVGTANTITATIDGGLVSTAPAITVTANDSGTISGTIFIDDNGTGVFGAGDTVVPGVVVTLTGKANGTTATIADATESTDGTNTVTITTSVPESFTAGQMITIAGATVTGYDGTFTIASVPTSTTFTYVAKTDGLAEDTSGTGSATIIQNADVSVSATTDANGHFTFLNVLPGHYDLQAGAVSALVNTTPSVGNINSVAGLPIVGGQTITHNIGYRPGFAASALTVAEFLTESTLANIPFAPAGSGVALATSRSNSAPTISNQIANIPSGSAPAGGSASFDLAGHFTDPDITDSEVTFNITANGVPEQVNVTLDDTTAPQTVANFFDYIKAGDYNGTFVSRETNTTTDGIGVLQAGGATITNGSAPKLITPLPTIPDEIGASNTDGTLAMANTGAANSASDQFYFNTASNTSLDTQFTVFGQAADPASLAILNSLGSTPTQDLGDSASITSVSESGNTVNVTTSGTALGANFAVGQTVTITGIATPGYNGTFVIATVSGTTFTYTDTNTLLANDTSGGSAIAGSAFARSSPSLLLNEVPLNGAAVTQFPTTTAPYVVINSIKIDKQSEFLTYSAASSDNTVVTASLQNEDLTLHYIHAGTATITVTATDSFGATVTMTFTVTVTSGPADAGMSSVAVLNSSIQSGGITTVTVTAEDAAGNPLTNLMSTDIVLALSGAGTSSGTFTGFTNLGGGMYSETFTGTTAGTANTITATIDGTLVSTTPSITVTPGPADAGMSSVAVLNSSIQSGGTTTVTVTAEDAAGNPLTNLMSTDIVLALSGAGTSSGTFTGFSNLGGGMYSETFTGTTAGTANTITATIDGTLVSTTPSITVTPGPIDLMQSTVAVNPTSISLSGVNQATVTLTTRDTFGNQETSGGATVFFIFGSGTTADGNFGPVMDNGDGTYSATFTGTMTGNANITATINGDPLTSSPATLAVNA